MKLKRLLGLCEEKGCFRRGNCNMKAEFINNDGGAVGTVERHLCQKHAFKVVRESIKHLKTDSGE